MFLELHATAMLCLPSGECLRPDATVCAALMSALYASVTEEVVLDRQLMVLPFIQCLVASVLFLTVILVLPHPGLYMCAWSCYVLFTLIFAVGKCIDFIEGQLLHRGCASVFSN